MQVVQELKFTYDTGLDPEIDKAVEDLIFLLQSKNQLITDKVTPNRGGATIVNRPSGIVGVTIHDYPKEAEKTWACGKKTGDTDCDCQFPSNTLWDEIRACQR